MSPSLHLVDPPPALAPAPGFVKLQPRTLVHQVIDALVAGASEGLILPGDRIVEADLALQPLGVLAQVELQALDLLAEELRLAQNALNQITGAFSSDDLLGVIFSSFCIGK